MKRSILTLALTAALSWSQTANKPATHSSSAPSGASSSTPSGADAVAQQQPNKVVATINGKQLTAKEANDLLKMIPESQRRTVPNVEQMLERLYMINDLAAKAENQGLANKSPLKEELKLNRDQLLAQAYMTNLTNSSSQPTEDPKQYYASHQDQFDIAKLSGIVVGFNPPGTPASPNGVNRTEEQAKQKAEDLERKLKTGTDLATLARTESDQKESAAKGGDLGTLSAGTPNVPPALKSAIFTQLQPGQISEPIRMPNAFFIVKLDSRSKQTFDQAKPEIEQTLKAQKSQTVVKAELDKYKIQVQDPSFFGTGSSGAKTPSLAKPSANTPSPRAATSPATH